MTANGYLLDTNVISETRKTRPARQITAFFEQVRARDLYVSVLTLGEIHKGAAAKETADPMFAARLRAWAYGIETEFGDHVLSVTPDVARQWGLLSAGRSLPVIDGLIAATAMANGLTVVTRNVRDFSSTSARLLNPWDAATT